METTGRHLFVYGTLMRAASGLLGAPQRARLELESVSLGAATLAGAQLYDLGRYPGLVESADKSLIVHGEVLELARPDETFAWLDEYEGIAGNDPDGEYVRLERFVHLAEGTALTAWVYIMTRELRGLAPVASGRWR